MSPKPRPRRSGRRGGLTRNPLLVAVATIVLVATVTFYAFNDGVPFVHGFTLYALVKNSVNVQPGTPVRIAGIDVGRVAGTAATGGLTRLTFTLQANGLPVHTDATLQIRDRLFLEGGYYLQLDPGSPGAPLAHSGATIPPGSTGYPVQFYQLLSVFDAPVRSDLVRTVRALDQAFTPGPGRAPSAPGSGASGLKAAIGPLAPTLRDVAWISGSLRGTRAGDLQRLLSSASAVTTTLQAHSGQLADLVTGLNRSSTALVAQDGALAQSISGLDQTLRAAPASLRSVDRSLPPLTNLATALDPSLKVSPPLIDAVVRTVRQLAGVVAPMERKPLLAALQTTFRTFPATLTQLGSVFPITKGVSDCLRTHLIPVLNTVMNDGPLSSGRPVWQDFAHLLEGLTSAVQNFDGNGYYLRVIGGGGTNGLSLGNAPGLGAILGSASTSTGPNVQGSRPQWVGDLTSADYRPDVPCETQPLPSLTSNSAASDLRGSFRAGRRP